MKFDFSGKKALVTGASRGIGLCIAKSLAENGAKVYALARNEQLLKNLAAEYPSITTIKCDLTESEAVIRSALEPHLPFHFVVNNAGVLTNETVFDIAPSSVEYIFSTNFKAPLTVSQITVKSMLEHGIKGSIVHVSSVSSTLPTVAIGTYCCSKAAVDMLCKVQAVELGPKGIRVNCVNPGIIKTDMGDIWVRPEDEPGYLERISLGEFAGVQDVANATMFLLSDGSAKTTGSMLYVEGGLHHT